MRRRVVLLLALLGAASAGAWLVHLWGLAPPALAQPPWPTPPPQLAVPYPVIVPPDQVKGVETPPIPGATVWLLQPFPRGIIPRVPPLPSTLLSSNETDQAQRILIRLEWESLPATTQLLYRPIPVSQAPAPPDGYRIRRAFALQAYDAQGRPFAPALRRPWVLRVPLAGLDSPDPLRLFLARYREDTGRWQLLVTAYHTQSRLLETRLLELGRYALLEEVLLP
ncbi:MAG: hypothetical protein ACK4K2_06340 [Dehalococcoidia bacterium]